jgi:hypothetical protein
VGGSSPLRRGIEIATLALFLGERAGQAAGKRSAAVILSEAKELSSSRRVGEEINCGGSSSKNRAQNDSMSAPTAILSIDSLSAAHDKQKLDEENPSPKLSS